DVWERLLRDVQQAAPNRLNSKRKKFASAKTMQECLEQRVELLVMIHLAKAGIASEFLPEGKQPQPDIALLDPLMGGLRIEVTSRWTTQLEELREELEADLEGAGYQVDIRCDAAPVRISDAERQGIRAKVASLVAAGGAFRLVEQLDVGYPELTVINMEVIGVPVQDSPEGTGEWVSYQVTGAELTDHMREVETRIADKLIDPAKNQQALAAPTVLLVEASRTGLAWIRSDSVWQGQLQTLLKNTETAFVAVGVIFADLGDLEI